ncbi:MAG: hypothetical protein NFCOHLIN_01218 [Gammaproteobacteria bacterium]|nr:hypothetical protein [Gammaproteobacteria bacterium]
MITGRLGLEGAQAALCQDFLGWQCRLRQMAMRHDQGRPSAGMRPTVTLPDGAVLGAIIVLITKREPEEATAQFRHMVLKTHDPADRYTSALQLLQAGYYQYPEEFSDVLSGLFSGGSPMCHRILEAGRCVLRFTEHGQTYTLSCSVRRPDQQHPVYQATYWHNSLFNPAMPGHVEVLTFLPDWSDAVAELCTAETAYPYGITPSEV